MDINVDWGMMNDEDHAKAIDDLVKANTMPWLNYLEANCVQRSFYKVEAVDTVIDRIRFVYTLDDDHGVRYKLMYGYA